MKYMQDHCTGKIENLSFGAEGITKNDGKVVFVPFTIPQELVSYHITSQKKNYAYGKLDAVLKESHYRIPPKCPYYTVCGGCQMQHISYDLQLDWKKKWVEDALNKMHKLNVIVNNTLPSLKTYAYRRHIHLHFKKENKTLSIGYVRADLQGIVSINECPIFLEDQKKLYERVYTFINLIAYKDFFQGKLIIQKNNDKFILCIISDEDFANSTVIAKQIVNFPEFTGVIYKVGFTIKQWGECESDYQLNSNQFCLSPLAFTQNNPELSAELYSQMASFVKPNEKILDLYCGVGISTLLISEKKGLVTGVEWNKTSIFLAKEHARKNGKTISFIQDDVEKFLLNNPNKNWNLIIVNPPRNGLSPKICQWLSPKKADKIIYISCMPTTLGRDLKKLTENGFKIKLVQPYDMFPQTTHVETFVYLEKV